MDEPRGRFALQARYVFPIESPPIPDGVVTIEGETIVAVGRKPIEADACDMGNVAILPGLVNAHAHLEFSSLKSPLGKPGMPLPAWIREVIRFRRERDDGKDAATLRQDALIAGLAESLAAGVTTLGEIASDSRAHETCLDETLDSTVFLELIGLRSGQIDGLRKAAKDWAERSRRWKSPWRPGLSPHAPYSVHPQLVREVQQLSVAARVPVAMHLAESVEELELLNSHSGPFVELLTDLDAWDPSALPRGIQPLDYLKMLATAHRVLVIHGNLLTDEEIALIGAQADRMSVVYCPRTFAYFAHGRYPLQKLLNAGVNVALGTDSRASNPDLSVLEEMRFVALDQATVPPHSILRMGTLAGAKALGVADVAGSLRPGKRADLACVELPDRAYAADPHELLLNATGKVGVTFVRGRQV